MEEVIVDRKPDIDSKAIIEESKQRFREDFERLMVKIDTPLAILMTAAFTFFAVGSFISKSYIFGAAFACFALINAIKLCVKFVASITSRKT